MDLTIVSKKNLFFVQDKASKELLNKGKGFPSKEKAQKYIDSMASASPLGEAGDALMPKPPMPEGDPMAAMLGAMGGGGPVGPGSPPMGRPTPMPGPAPMGPGSMPGAPLPPSPLGLEKLRMKPRM